jgi:hypothetical protein
MEQEGRPGLCKGREDRGVGVKEVKGMLDKWNGFRGLQCQGGLILDKRNGMK